jgi:hypothetical protein
VLPNLNLNARFSFSFLAAQVSNAQLFSFLFTNFIYIKIWKILIFWGNFWPFFSFFLAVGAKLRHTVPLRRYRHDDEAGQHPWQTVEVSVHRPVKWALVNNSVYSFFTHASSTREFNLGMLLLLWVRELDRWSTLLIRDQHKNGLVTRLWTKELDLAPTRILFRPVLCLQLPVMRAGSVLSFFIIFNSHIWNEHKLISGLIGPVIDGIEWTILELLIDILDNANQCWR